MMARIARRMAERAYAKLNRGDLDGLMATFTADAVFSFPGGHELAGEYRGREQIRAFFVRLLEWFPELRFEVCDVAVSGPPWRMRLFVRYHDTAARDGVTWSGWGTQYAWVRWGRLERDYITNDTEAVRRYVIAVSAARATLRKVPPAPDSSPEIGRRT